MLPKATGTWTKAEARHLLNRAGFGGSPDEISRFHALGREAAVDVLLNPEESIKAFPMPEWADLESALAKSHEHLVERQEMMEKIKTLPSDEGAKLRRMIQGERQKEVRRQGIEAQGWWFRRMLRTQAPLREKMTLFWHDHFATSAQKVREPMFLMNQNALFREHATGNFRDLTQAIVRDPAMMLYLDLPRSSREKPNENFAREVMELFTLGEGNYTETDVREAARAFTGYVLNRRTGEVTQNVTRWDGSEKTLFGRSGRFNGTDVVKLIFRKDECANFMAGKLWEFFVYENPGPTIQISLGDSLRKNDYEIAPVLREIFLSEEFYRENSRAVQIKSPIQYLVQMLKELELEEPPPSLPILGQTQLGQQLFMPPNVAGWDWGKAWINTNTLLARYNLAGMVTKGGLGDNRTGKMRLGKMRGRRSRQGKSTAPDYASLVAERDRQDVSRLVDGLIGRFFSMPIPEKARTSFIEYAEEKRGVAFTDTELGELCHLMLSTPYYQLC
ncbi:DUF1800 family protein [Luteolibacter algae]|uniref:DUF1800 family protein n=1 Tax=Luteolibacter algae TaxID=454151 RepID=A0ABW5DAA0_9BACT